MENSKKRIEIVLQIIGLMYIGLLFFIIVLKNGDAFIILKLSDKDRTLTEIINSINLIPFWTILNYIKSDLSINIILRNVLGNIVLFIPLGLILYKACSNKIKRALPASFLTSVLFEIVQVFLNIGSGDIDDIILNTLGAIIGIIISKKFFYF